MAAAAAGPPGEVEAPGRWPRTRDRDGPRPGPALECGRGLLTVRNLRIFVQRLPGVTVALAL